MKEHQILPLVVSNVVQRKKDHGNQKMHLSREEKNFRDPSYRYLLESSSDTTEPRFTIRR